MIQHSRFVQIVPLYDWQNNISVVTGVARFRGAPSLFRICMQRDSGNWELHSRLIPGPVLLFPTWRDAVARIESVLE